jgi:hypothetical protein
LRWRKRMRLLDQYAFRVSCGSGILSCKTGLHQSAILEMSILLWFLLPESLKK